MRPFKIHVAQNGYVLEDEFGGFHIAATLQDLGRLTGETITHSYTVYESNMSANHLSQVRAMAANGQKIKAIQLLRDCFTPRLGLREAKDLIERLCF